MELINIPRHEDERGNLSFIEHGLKGVCPFEIERVYWIYDVPAGRERHGRALRHTAELIVAMSGSCTLRLDDGTVSQTVRLDRSDRGVLVPPGTWRSITDFSTNGILMVLASDKFAPAEYIYDYEQFRAEK